MTYWPSTIFQTRLCYWIHYTSTKIQGVLWDAPRRAEIQGKRIPITTAHYNPILVSTSRIFEWTQLLAARKYQLKWHVFWHFRIYFTSDSLLTWRFRLGKAAFGLSPSMRLRGPSWVRRTAQAQKVWFSHSALLVPPRIIGYPPKI